MITSLKKNLKKISSLRFLKPFSQVEKSTVLFFFCMVLIISLATLIRIMPFQWGFNLSEFDPYYQYDVTRHIVENGLLSWQNWHIDDMWFPQGRDVAYTSFPGLPMTGAIFYFLVSNLGFQVSVMDVCIIFPVIFATITCIVIYYLGKSVGGSSVGLLSALLLAVTPAFIGRTSLGFYDDETIGIFGILLTSLFYFRSLQQEEKWQISLVYSITAGATLGYVFASWGASKYLLSLLALSTFFLLLSKRYTRRLLLSYGVLLTVGLSIAVLVPKLGFGYIRQFESVAAIGVFLILLFYEISNFFSEKRRTIVMGLSLIALSASAILLWKVGFLSLPLGKFLSVINPFHRIEIPLIESVQEHRPATWSAFYYQFGTLVFLAPLGLIFTLQNITREKIFLITFAVTTLYFSASMIRLTIMLAPALCILGALAIVNIVKPFTDIAMQRLFSRRRLRLHPTTGRGFSVFLIISLFTLTLLPMGRWIDSAYSPTTISSSSLPIRTEISDWTDSLLWMKANLPEDAVVASWWDYGYWISVIGEKFSLADNGTFNGSQIAWIGRMFMSTEEEALAMILDFNNYAKSSYNFDNTISYVVVFSTLSLASSGQYLFGDEVKWRWMAKIGWNSSADLSLEDTSITSQLANAWSSQTQDPSLLQWYYEFSQIALPKADAVLTKLMIYGAFKINPPEHFDLIFSSSRNLVFVYKIIY